MPVSRDLHRTVLASLSLVASAACGGATTPPPGPVTVAVAKAAAPPLPVDLSQAPEPPSLVFFGRVAKPSDVLKIAGAWTRLPMPGAEVMTEMLTGEHTGKLTDLDQPVDIAVATDPSRHSLSPVWAVSAAVSSLEDAKATLGDHYKLVPGENGALVVNGLGVAGDGDADDDQSTRSCELAPSAGAAATRLVCGSSEAALRVLAPYLTRTAPRATIASDVHLEMRFGPLKTFVALGRTLMPSMLAGPLDVKRSNNPAAADLIEAATGEICDLATDLDKITLDAKLDDALAHFDMQATFRANASLSTRIATGHPDRADSAPSSFWRLPGDTDLALFNRGIDAKDIDRPRTLILNVLGHALDQDGLAEDDRKAILDALSHTMTTPAPVVLAKGVDFAAAEHAIAAVGAAKDDAAREQAAASAAEQILGWWMVGIDESAARLQSALKEIAGAWNRPSVAKWIKTDAHGKTPPSLKLAAVPTSLKLPHDTTHLELTIFPESPTPKGAGPARPLTLHAFVVPDGGRVWLVLGANASLLASKVRQALAGAPTDGTLSARVGLETMKDAHVNGGGFVTVRGLMTLSPDALGQMRRHAGDPLASIVQLADQGATPIVFSETAMPGSEASPVGSLTATARMPKAVVEGIERLVIQGAHF